VARRILSIAGGVALTACQVGPIEIVECGVNADCAAEQYCELPSHRCVPFALPPGSGQSGGLAPTALEWTDLGQVIGSTNPLGINGTWWLHDDCSTATPEIAAGTLVCPAAWTTPTCCTEYDASLTGPAPDRQQGLSITTGGAGVPARACLKGTLTRVLTDGSGQVRYDLNWGIAFELPFADFLPFDATRAFPGGALVGFMLDLDSPLPGTSVRVGIRGESDHPYFVDILLPAKNAPVLFSEGKQGDWVTPQLPLDHADLRSIHVSIPPSADTSLPFDFCISHLRALQQPAASN
jgi:hypothetical protein